MKYKINIHAHTFFSDGRNSPIEMARECKRLGFSALVLTDHYYGGAHPEKEINNTIMHLYKKAIDEARTILPVIRGMEVAFMGEEFLLFGSTAIKWLLDTHSLKTVDDLKKMKDNHHCAIVLCHPMNRHDEFAHLLDGYERHNSGQDWFHDDRPLGTLKGLQAWHNSDAHMFEGLKNGYNIIDSKITEEKDLIKYIRSGKVNEYYAQCEEG